MESVVTKALSNLPLDEKSASGNTRSLNTGKRNGEDQVYKVRSRKLENFYRQNLILLRV